MSKHHITIILEVDAGPHGDVAVTERLVKDALATARPGRLWTWEERIAADVLVSEVPST